MATSLVVHSTHEAGAKVGGIGSVLAGVLGSRAWRAEVRRDVLAGALDPETRARTFAPGGLRLHYAPGHGILDVPPDLAGALSAIERAHGVALLLGSRGFGGRRVEVLLVDVDHARPGPVGETKYHLWRCAGIDSRRYEHDPEYERQLRAAAPLLAAVEALAARRGVDGQPPATGGRRWILAHEWMGVPLALLARARAPARWRLAFHAHEVAAARAEVEGHPGHDLRFYNALRLGLDQGRDMAEVLGPRDGFHKHALVEAAGDFQAVLAVGDRVVDELRWLGGPWRHRPIELVYNGVPADAPTPERREASRALLRRWLADLLGFPPDFVFTHVTRMVPSKGLWRDLRVLAELDPLLERRGERAVLVVLSSARPGGRDPEAVRRWEAEYGWPADHRAGNGDLLDHELPFWFDGVQPFHATARASRVVLVNQFGFGRGPCGERMPEGLGFEDLRLGTDLEFGQSIYEPFGIAQLEALRAGALAVLSDACGSLGLLRETFGGMPPEVVVGAYTRPPEGWVFARPEDALRVDRWGRDLVEAARAREIARIVDRRLPRTADERAARLRAGSALAARMSWEVIVDERLVPALRRR